MKTICAVMIPSDYFAHVHIYVYISTSTCTDCADKLLSVQIDASIAFDGTLLAENAIAQTVLHSKVKVRKHWNKMQEGV